MARQLVLLVLLVAGCARLPAVGTCREARQLCSSTRVRLAMLTHPELVDACATLLAACAARRDPETPPAARALADPRPGGDRGPEGGPRWL